MIKITNERQYRITKTHIAKFEASLADIVSRNTATESPSKLHLAVEAGQRAQLDMLNRQASDYEALKAGKTTTFSSDTFGGLPLALISARIAAGMTQRDLANKLGLKEQQIQRYEATSYASASFDRLRAIVDVLGVTVKEEITLAKRAA